jgi:hypothetical protein
MVDSLGKEPNDINHSLMLLTKQLAVMRPYIKKHLQELRERIQDETLIMKQHKLHFTAWLKDLKIHIGETPEEKMIYLLVVGPHSVVKP